MKMIEEQVGESLCSALKQRRSLISLKELAEMFGVSDDTIYRMVKSFRIPSVRIGYQIRFDPQVIASWLEARNSYGKTRSGKTLWFVT